MSLQKHRTLFTLLHLVFVVALIPDSTVAQRQMESLDRGVIALHRGDGDIYVGWRLRGTEPADLGFNVYRKTGAQAPVKLNDTPITGSTNYLDRPPTLEKKNTYVVRSVYNGQERDASKPVTVPANPPVQKYRSIPLKGNYPVNKIGVGDLNGDGSYDYVIKQPEQVTDPGAYHKSDDTWKIEAYSSSGKFLWRRDLGPNIVQGIWWSPMVVYDFNGDGRAEVATKTAPTDKDFRRPSDGRVVKGPEWVSVFDGQTGEELARKPWISRGEATDWGDDYWNRAMRNQILVAYLDGKTPSLIVCRGTYALMKVDAWRFQNGNLQHQWRWTNKDLPQKYQGQGFHSTTAYDLDGDGNDEILNGGLVIQEDGSTGWTTGQGDGDEFHLADIIPGRTGLEILYIQEKPEDYDYPIHVTDAETGEIIWGVEDDGSFGDIGDGLAADIDPDEPGLEVWGAANGAKYLYNAEGDILSDHRPPHDLAIWWDGDTGRELTSGENIYKWDPEKEKAEVIDRFPRYRAVDDPVRGRQSTSARIVADVIGDWREEVIVALKGELRIYTSTVVTDQRFYTLMHNPLYRTGVAVMSMGYLQSAHPDYFFGFGMNQPKRPDITTGQ